MTDPTKPAEPPTVGKPSRLDRVGCWFISVDGRPKPVAAWSPSDDESDLSTAEPQTFDAAAYVASLPVRREGTLDPQWPWLVAATLVLLAAAWWWLRR